MPDGQFFFFVDVGAVRGSIINTCMMVERWRWRRRGRREMGREREQVEVEGEGGGEGEG